MPLDIGRQRRMGQTLSEPDTNKHSATVQNYRVKVGSSSMQGWRTTMEDAHTHILELPGDREASFFGVYDGHGGSRVSNYASRNLHKFIVHRPEYQNDDIGSAIIEVREYLRNVSDLKLT